LAQTVAGELAGDGLECQCVCPMCSLGACGCVGLGHHVAISPLAPPDSAAPDSGFTLESPRTGSQLAAAGVVAGDRLLAVDDEAVAAVLDIQAAIRKHNIGESVQLLIAHGDSTRRIEVTHVSDY
jgi:S1-C subfamily serine protease